MLQALRRHDWPAASGLAADVLGRKLVDFIRLLNPGQASAGELAAFLAANPDWPDRAVLERRYGEALSSTPDPLAGGQCHARLPRDPRAVLRCAEAFSLAGDAAGAEAAARAAWVSGLTTPSEEAAFAARWGAVTRAADQQRRFDHLAVSDFAAAARQVARLTPAAQPVAAARIALRAQAPEARAKLAAVPASGQTDPALLLDEARYLRLSDEVAEAALLWRTAVIAAEAACPPALRAGFWTEREALARRMLADGDAKMAFALANDTALAGEQAAEPAFLAGWIALVVLKDAATARPLFAAAAGPAHAAIAASRIHYWMGRAAADGAAARAEFLAASAFPMTYYGQLAARAAGLAEAALQARILAARDPAVSDADSRALQSDPLLLAADRLMDWGDRRRAADFLRQAMQPPSPPARIVVAARAALRLGLPDIAVHAARMAGRAGLALPESGWPMPVMPRPGPVPPALVLGVVRQESSFDPGIVSGAGAMGLMQVMPATARELAHAAHVAAGPLSDAAVNMRLGAQYLAGLLQRFGAVPVAVAAYDAGPHRVQTWLDAAVVPAPHDDASTADWIEAVPFAETRGYVQRVLENTEVYAARLARK